MENNLLFVDPLSPREGEVLVLMAQGLTNAEIGSLLGIVEHTVQSHVETVRSKLGVHTRTQCVVKGVQLGLCEIDMRDE